HIQYMTNFELHRRKTFWVDEALTYVLAQTDLDVPWSDLRLPFNCFALVFRDRYVLSLVERMLSADRQCPLAGYFLRVATVYVTEERQVSNRILRVRFALETLGADPPHLDTHEIPPAEDAIVGRYIKSLVPQSVVDLEVPDSHPLRRLLHIALSAILYATSAGVAPELRRSPMESRRSDPKSELDSLVFTSENVFFLQGSIAISRLRSLQELERLPSGRKILHRFMVRSHWRRPAAGWKDQRMRWIAPYWKGPDIAAVIERAYKLKP
ncbi:MAG: hypothetical protein V1876_03960, partial [Candidatus Peregrinibacteria bacterium]